jgi:hypothetical protein
MTSANFDGAVVSGLSVWAGFAGLGCVGCLLSVCTTRLGGIVSSVALVEDFSFATTGAIGSARTTGVPDESNTKFKAMSREFQVGFI